MTVESRLLISHLIMFIVPIFMTVIVAAVMPAGAPTLSRGNNYLYLENISKCTRAAEISSHIFLHGDLDHPENSMGSSLIPMISPDQNFLLLTKGDTPIYTYGNKEYLSQLGQIPIRADKNDIYFHGEGENFYYEKHL